MFLFFAPLLVGDIETVLRPKREKRVVVRNTKWVLGVGEGGGFRRQCNRREETELPNEERPARNTPGNLYTRGTLANVVSCRFAGERFNIGYFQVVAWSTFPLSHCVRVLFWESCRTIAYRYPLSSLLRNGGEIANMVTLPTCNAHLKPSYRKYFVKISR